MKKFTIKEITNTPLLTPAAKDWATDNLHYLNKPMQLFGSSTKVEKGSDKFSTYILYMQPANKVSALTLCLGAESAGCLLGCLINSGLLGKTNGQNAATKRTILFLMRREWFFAQLLKEIDAAERKAQRAGIPALFRLNGTSDIDFSELIKQRPNSQFYDYTKLLARVSKNALPNYDLTYSASMYSKQSKRALRKAVQRKLRIAVAYNTKESKGETLRIPSQFISFDKTDLRHLDPKEIGTLKRKGSNKEERQAENQKANSFFVTETNEEEFQQLIAVKQLAA